jgi:hypothetical protein
MAVRVVVYDPDDALPSSFERDAGLDAAFGDTIVQLDRATDAHCIGRDAAVLVLVAGHDRSAVVGCLASAGERRHARLVLVVADARRDRGLVIRAARRGAIVLIGQTPSALAACLRDLLVPHPLPPEAEQACLTAAASLSPQARTLLLAAANRARPEAGAEDLAHAFGISARTLSRRVRSTEWRSVSELVGWGRLARALTLSDARATPELQAQLGGFPSVRSFERARHHMLATVPRGDQRSRALSSVANALAARCTTAQGSGAHRVGEMTLA